MDGAPNGIYLVISFFVLEYAMLYILTYILQVYMGHLRYYDQSTSH